MILKLLNLKHFYRSIILYDVTETSHHHVCCRFTLCYTLCVCVCVLGCFINLRCVLRLLLT